MLHNVLDMLAFLEEVEESQVRGFQTTRCSNIRCKLDAFNTKYQCHTMTRLNQPANEQHSSPCKVREDDVTAMLVNDGATSTVRCSQLLQT